MYHSGDSDQEPLRNALNQSFYVAGINGAVATTAALFQRMFTGQGQSIDVSTVECLASHLVQAVPYYSYMGAIKGRRPVRGSGFEELMPARGRVRDSVGAGFAALEHGGGADRAAGVAGRAVRLRRGDASSSAREISELLIKGLAQWDRKALHQASGERRLVFGMAQDAGDLHDCPHLRERDFFRVVDHPVAGAANYPGMGPRLSGPDSLPIEYEVRRPAPLLGQHNGEIYGDELGRSPGELAKLRALGAI